MTHTLTLLTTRLILLTALSLTALSRASAQSSALSQIVEAAKASNTDALYLWKDGVALIDTTFTGEP